MVVGAALPSLQARRSEKWRERAEIRLADVAYLIATCHLVTFLTDVAKRPTTTLSGHDRVEPRRLDEVRLVGTVAIIPFTDRAHGPQAPSLPWAG